LNVVEALRASGSRESRVVGEAISVKDYGSSQSSSELRRNEHTDEHVRKRFRTQLDVAVNLLLLPPSVLLPPFPFMQLEAGGLLSLVSELVEICLTQNLLFLLTAVRSAASAATLAKYRLSRLTSDPPSPSKLASFELELAQTGSESTLRLLVAGALRSTLTSSS